MKIGIAGAGIGGLTLAALLGKKNIQVKLFEKASALRDVGAGIALFSNGTKVLNKLDPNFIDQDSSPIKKFSVCLSSGKTLVDLPYDKVAKTLGHDNYILQRSFVQKKLKSMIDKNQIITNKGVSRLELNNNKPKVHFSDGQSEEFDIFIGADGAKSAVRDSLFGGPPKYRQTKQSCYRSIVDISTKNSSDNFEIYGKNGDRFGIHPISEDKLYFWITINSKEQLGLSELKKRFVNWPNNISKILDNCSDDKIIFSDLYDLPPRKKWGEGNVTLIGDAAHLSTPNLGQGGNMALEDAFILSEKLEGCLGGLDIPTTLREYESERIKRTSQMVNKAHLFGIMGGLSNPFLQEIRNVFYITTPPKIYYKTILDQLSF